MGKNAFLAVFFLFMIVPDVCDASLLKFRKLIGAGPRDSNPAAMPSSPSPSPVPSNKNPSIKPANGSTNNKPEPPVPNKSTLGDPKGHPKDSSKKNNHSSGNDNNEKNIGTTPKKKDEQKTDDSSTEKCESGDKTCNDRGKMTACIKNYQQGSKELLVLVQNGGESALKVNLTVESTSKTLDIPKHHTKGTDILLAGDKSSKLILNAGNGDCELLVGPPEGSNSFVRLPSYHKLVTPVNGAYFLILTVLVFGGTWACCKLRKRRHPGGVPYQELEMGLPESVSATNVETAEGWDQGWDDDWDENNAVKPQGLVGSISANGLTSRSSNKDGWENNWND